MKPPANTNDPVATLCPACGLCCSGVLFGDVELQPGDDARRLAGLGLRLKRKGRKEAFAQPCACFDGTLCGIYADRPGRCRAFECGQLKRVQSGAATVEAALKKIHQARRQADKVRALLRQLGETSEALPLNKRYARVMRRPIDLADGEEAVELRAELMMAVSRLMETASRDFLS